MPRTVAGAGWLLVLVLLVAVPRPGATQDVLESRITYVVGQSVYIEAGRDAGLVVGSRLEVVRGGEAIAVLEVVDLSSRRSSCVVRSSTAEPAVGDLVRLAPGQAIPPAEPVEAEVVPAPPVARSSSPGGLRGLGLRGRVGLRFLTVQDRSGTGEDFSQPAVDVYAVGTRVGGSDFDLAVDVRARRTHRVRTDGESDTEGHTRVYRLALAWQRETSPLRLTVGRQVSPDLASVSIFDGGLAEFRKTRWSLGAFGGTQPDPIDLGYSSDIVEYGAYLRLQEQPGSRFRWSTTLGWISSSVSGTTNREFAFLRANASTGGLNANLTQEVDVNRGWRADMEGESVSFTSTYAFLRYQFSRNLGAYASYDNRRRVRLYRDRETPESEFDDSYRQGIRGGIDTRPLRFLRLGFGITHQVGVSAGNASSYSMYLRAVAPRPVQTDFGTRVTRYEGPLADGWLVSGSVGRPITSRLDLEFHGGLREETRYLGASTDVSIAWWGLGVDYRIARGWYALLTSDWTNGADEDNTQVYLSLTTRF